MPSYRPPKIASSEITPQSAYLNRRRFMAGAAAGLALAAAPAALAAPIDAKKTDYTVDENLTSFEDITHWNNFYEFRAQASDISSLVGTFKPQPWRIEIGGLVNKPTVLGFDDVLKDFTQEERVYRMRCVEAWSMVIPWVGFPLSALIDRAEPLASAKYVAFETVVRPAEMPNQRGLFQSMPWPYVEGLRLDEARHPLTILATGVYGQTLPNQNGAPIRLVVPWKYGFKGIKSIVKITLTETQPPSSWNLLAPQEYGFYANVNPEVDHPRWSQATERRIGEAQGLFGGARLKTLPFNGYGEEVAGLYAGMDLTKNY